MSSKRNITYKCPYCDKRFNKENLVIHVGDKHDDMIPENYSAFRLVFDYINKKPSNYNGKCIICGKESGWDENKGKYNRICNNPACKAAYIKTFEDRMIRSKGVKRISSTAEGQAKMLANRKISGTYKFCDGVEKTYTGTYELKALEFMDKVMNIKSEDISTPGPIMEYMFEGKKHIYISDIYYAPYNLIIEVKDGGDNPNNRSMPEYRAKQIAKEKYIIKNTDFNYLRLTNNDFSQLLAVFMELKMEMSNDEPGRVIRINENMIQERSLSSGSVLLYHGSIDGSYDKILNNSPNMGKKYEVARTSSFWFKEKEYAEMFATGELLQKVSDKKIFILIDDDMKTLVEDQYKSLALDIIKNNNCYVYSKLMDGKDVTGGQGRNFPEYTIDFVVKPDKVEKVSYKGKLNSIKFVSKDYIDKVINKYKKNKMTYGNSLFGQIKDSLIYSGNEDIWNNKRTMKGYNESYIEEGFLKSEPDILYNKEAFDNGDINICFVTGHSGSGKSTLAHNKEKEDKSVEVYEMDDLQCIADRFTMDNLKEYGDLIYTYFKGPGKQFYTTWEKLKEDKTPGKDYEDKLYPGFVAYAIDWAKKHKDKKYILEGVWLFCDDETGKPYFEPSYFKDYAFYIKGTSGIKSKYRAAKRDMKYDQKEESHSRLFWIKSFSKSFFLKNWKWYKFDEKRIQVFRDYFKNKPETVLSEAVLLEAKNNKKYYHVSQSNLNGKILQPSIPNNYFTKNGYEDNKTKRVCFTDSIDNCLRALSQKCTGMELYVHILDGNYNVYKPSIEEVPDSKVTGEVWVTKPCKVKCIGKIKVTGDRGEDGLPFKYGDKTAELYDWNWEWIEQLSESVLLETSISRYKKIKIDKSLIESDPVFKHIREDHCRGYAFYDKDKLVGFVNVEDKDGESWIQALEIMPDYRNQGLGKSILDIAVKELKANYLSVNKKNTIAISMYKKYGFKVYKETESMYFMSLKEELSESLGYYTYNTGVEVYNSSKEMKTLNRILADKINSTSYKWYKIVIDSYVPETAKKQQGSIVTLYGFNDIPKTTNLLKENPETIYEVKYNNYYVRENDFNKKFIPYLYNNGSSKKGFIIISEGGEYIMDNNIKEAMNALMAGFIPGSVDNPNNVYIVNYMQNNVFSGEDPNEDCIGVSSDPLFTNLIVRDKDGILKKVDESFLDDKSYKVFIAEKSVEEISKAVSPYIDKEVEYGFLYEVATGKKLYTNDQVGLEGVLIPTMDYYEYMDQFKEVCDNFFFAKDKKPVSFSESFIPDKVRYFNKSGLMYENNTNNDIDNYVQSKPEKILEYLDISIN